MGRRTLGLLLGIVLTVYAGQLVYGQSSAPAPKAPKATQVSQFHVAMPTWLGFSPLLIAQEMKLDNAQGISLKLERIDNVQAIFSAVSAGRIDGVCTTIDTAVRARAMGIPLVIVLGLDSSFGGDGLVASREIKTVADLKGKEVALQVGSPSHFFFLKIISKAGLKADEVKIIPMEPGDAGAAFVAGRVAAAVTWEPWLSKHSEREGGHLLVSTADMPGLIVDVLVVSETFLKANRTTVENICKTWFSALDVIKKDRQKAFTIMANGVGIPVADVEAMVRGIRFYGPEENRELFFGRDPQKEKIRDLVQEVDTFWRALKLTDKNVRASEILDDQPLSRALTGS